MIELEILVEVFDLYNSIEKELSKFNFVKECLIEDTYYYDPLRKNLKPNTYGKTFECLRIRNYAGESKLTYKQDVYNKEIWQYSNENEVSIDNFNEMDKILSQLGFQKLLTIHNKRKYYIHENYKIVLEDVENLGIYLEVEFKGDLQKEEINQEKQKIWHFIKSLKLKTSEELNAGKPELFIIKHKIQV